MNFCSYRKKTYRFKLGQILLICFTTFSSPDINSPDSFGKTPLHNAILGKHVSIVELLLKSGADVKCLDERGDTPLHAAVKVDSEAIVVVRLPFFLKNHELV